MRNYGMSNAQLNSLLEAIAQLIESSTGDKEAADIVRRFKTPTMMK